MARTIRMATSRSTPSIRTYFSFHRAIKQYVRPTEKMFPRNFADEFFAKAIDQADMTYGDLGRVLSWIEESGRRHYVNLLRPIAPHTPLTAAVVLQHGWDKFGWDKFGDRRRKEMMKLAELFESSIRSESGYNFDIDAAFKAMPERRRSD